MYVCRVCLLALAKVESADETADQPNQNGDNDTNEQPHLYVLPPHDILQLPR